MVWPKKKWCKKGTEYRKMGEVELLKEFAVFVGEFKKKEHLYELRWRKEKVLGPLGIKQLFNQPNPGIKAPRSFTTTVLGRMLEGDGGRYILL